MDRTGLRFETMEHGGEYESDDSEATAMFACGKTGFKNQRIACGPIEFCCHFFERRSS
jgi:hypothetical protein